MARPRYTEADRDARIMMDAGIIKHLTAEEKLSHLNAALDQLQDDFGSWKTPWGEINRFQRLTGNIKESYDDNKPSLPVAFTSSLWGSLGAWGTEGVACDLTGDGLLSFEDLNVVLANFGSSCQ